MARVLALAIETSNPSAVGGAGSAPGPGVAVGWIEPGSPQRTEVLAREALRASDRRRDDLLPCIDRCARAAGVLPTDIGLVAFSAGPGGFTSLRSACATAKMIAYAAAAKSRREVRGCAVPTAAAVADALMHSPERSASASWCALVVALGGKGERAFVTAFAELQGGASGWVMPATGAGRMLDPVEIGTLVQSLSAPRGAVVLAADEHIPGVVVEAALAAGAVRVVPVFDPVSVLRCAAVAAHSPGAGGWIDPLGLAPIYGREPEAVTRWRQRGAR
jgi:hypothetical protein